MKIMDRIDLQQLRDLPIEGVAERLGLDVRQHKALCPFHNDHHPSLSFSVRKNTYRCFVCDAHGGTIDLVMHLLHKDFREACAWLGGEEISRVQGVQGVQGSRVQDVREEAKPFDASRYERFFERPWLSGAARRFLFEERRLDERVVRWCRLTSWRDRNGVDWLQIPYYDRDGHLIGIQNRNLNLNANVNGLPRFRFPKGSRCGIYNLPVLNLLKEGEELYITEGASDCWAMLSSGHKAIAIPSATLLSKKDKEQLSILNSQLSISYHMFPDRDLPGERLFLQLKDLLPSLQHHQLPPTCKDYSDYYLQNLLAATRQGASKVERRASSLALPRCRSVDEVKSINLIN